MFKKDIIIDSIIVEHQEDDASRLDRIKIYKEKLIELKEKDTGIYSAEAD